MISMANERSQSRDLTTTISNPQLYNHTKCIYRCLDLNLVKVTFWMYVYSAIDYFPFKGTLQCL